MFLGGELDILLTAQLQNRILLYERGKRGVLVVCYFWRWPDWRMAADRAQPGSEALS